MPTDELFFSLVDPDESELSSAEYQQRQIVAHRRFYFELEFLCDDDCAGAAKAIADAGLLKDGETEESLRAKYERRIERGETSFYRSYEKGSYRPPSAIVGYYSSGCVVSHSTTPTMRHATLGFVQPFAQSSNSNQQQQMSQPSTQPESSSRTDEAPSKRRKK